MHIYFQASFIGGHHYHHQGRQHHRPKTPQLEGVYLVIHTSLYLVFGLWCYLPWWWWWSTPKYVGIQFDCISKRTGLDQLVDGEMNDMHGINIEKSGTQFRIASFIFTACFSPSMHVRALGIWCLLLGTTVRFPDMPSMLDLSRSCMRYIFMEDFSEIAKSEENTNVEQKSQHCCHSDSVINQVKHVLFSKFPLIFLMEMFAFLSCSNHVFTFLSYLHLTHSVAHIFWCLYISSSFCDFYL